MSDIIDVEIVEQSIPAVDITVDENSAQRASDAADRAESVIRSVENPDKVLKYGEIEVEALQVKVLANAFQWRLNNVDFLITPFYTKNLDAAADANFRTDVLLGNTSGGYQIFKGSEDPLSAVEPTNLPIGTIKLGLINIFGAVVVGATIDVSGFITKAEKNFIIMSAPGHVDKVEVYDKTYLKFDTGMLSLKSVNISDTKYLYHGKEFIFKNGTAGNVTLYHNLGTGNFKLNIPGNQNLILKPEESVSFVMRAINFAGNGGLLDYVGIASNVDLSNYYTKSEVDGKVSSVLKYKGSVANYAALPSSGMVIGDVYNLTDTGHNYAWSGTFWDDLGPAVDISGKEDSSNKSNSVGDISSTTKFPVWKAITDWAIAYFDAARIKTILGVSTLSGDNTGDQDLSVYAKKYGTRTALAGTVINWSTDTDTYTKTLTANTTLTDSNLPSGTNTRTITLIIDGAFTLTVPSYWKLKGGVYSTTKQNQIVLQCVNGTAGSERVNYVINPDIL